MPEGSCCDHLEPAGLPDGIPQRGLAVQALPVLRETREVGAPDRARVLLRGAGADEQQATGLARVLLPLNRGAAKMK
jgi:hypothetical protein